LLFRALIFLEMQNMSFVIPGVLSLKLTQRENDNNNDNDDIERDELTFQSANKAQQGG